MLFAALSNAVCLHNAFLAINFCKCFVFMLCLGLMTHSLFISSLLLICCFFLILCSHFLSKYERAMCYLEK